MSLITAIITYTMFLPIIFSPINTNQKFGAYWWSTIDQQYIVKGQWVKLDISWESTESVYGQYNWSEILDANVEFLKSIGSPVLFNYHNSPDWARISDKPCSLPDDAYVDEYIKFIRESIVRYRPNAIEIWNEPESNSNEYSGWCCGCIPNPEDYVEMLGLVYDNIHKDFPEVIILGGAFTQTDSAWIDNFLALNPKMDAISFHYYGYYVPEVSVPFVGGLYERVWYFQDNSDKPIWLTETSLLCTYGSLCTDVFRNQQAIWLRLVNNVSGLEKVFWFSENEVWWNYCNMLNERKSIVFPVYDIFVSLFRSPIFVRPIRVIK